MNILFVCTGNVSRSFLAEMLLKDRIREHGLENISVSSAGLYAYPGTPGDPKIEKYLSEMGVPAENHESIQLTERELEWADLVLVMERHHQESIINRWPESKDKIELLGVYIRGGPVVDDIIDPYGGSSYHYRVAQSQIGLAVEGLIRTLVSGHKKISPTHL